MVPYVTNLCDGKQSSCILLFIVLFIYFNVLIANEHVVWYNMAALVQICLHCSVWYLSQKDLNLLDSDDREWSFEFSRNTQSWHYCIT